MAVYKCNLKVVFNARFYANLRKSQKSYRSRRHHYNTHTCIPLSCRRSSLLAVRLLEFPIIIFVARSRFNNARTALFLVKIRAKSSPKDGSRHASQGKTQSIGPLASRTRSSEKSCKKLDHRWTETKRSDTQVK